MTYENMSVQNPENLLRSRHSFGAGWMFWGGLLGYILTRSVNLGQICFGHYSRGRTKSTVLITDGRGPVGSIISKTAAAPSCSTREFRPVLFGNHLRVARPKVRHIIKGVLKISPSEAFRRGDFFSFQKIRLVEREQDKKEFLASQNIWYIGYWKKEK